MSTRRTVVETTGNVYVSDLETVTPTTDAGLYDSLNDAVTDIGGTATTLLVNKNFTLTANLVIPSNICLRVEKGGSITKASTYTLTINGTVDIGLYQAFKSFASGNVTFGALVSEVYPEWWGIDGTADEVEINYAINSGVARVRLTGVYSTAAAIVPIAGTHLVGSGRATKISAAAVGFYGINTISSNVVVESVWVYGFSTTGTGDAGINLGTLANQVTNCRVSNCEVSNFNLSAITGYYTFSIIENNYFHDFGDAGMYVGGYCAYNLVSGNRIVTVNYSGIDCNGSWNRIVNNNISACGGGAADKASWAGILIWYTATGDYKNADGNIVSGNRVYDCLGCGIQVGNAASSAPVHPSGNIISNNVVSGNTHWEAGSLEPAGIAVYGGSYNTVEGNYSVANKYNYCISGYAGYNGEGLIIANNISSDAVADGFYFYDAGGYAAGVSSGGQNRVIVVNNIDTNAGDSGFKFETATALASHHGYRIVGNMSFDATIYGFSNVDHTQFFGYLFEDNICHGAGTADYNNFGLHTLYDINGALNSATPSVEGGCKLFITANTGATAITNFANGHVGQVITVVFNDAVTTMASGASILLHGSFAPNAGDSITLVYDGTYWRELSRIAVISGSVVWNPGSLNDGVGETSASITATGADLGDFVLVSAPYDLQGITCNGYVDAANSVKIRLQNETTGVIDLASGTWKVKVIK